MDYVDMFLAKENPDSPLYSERLSLALMLQLGKEVFGVHSRRIEDTILDEDELAEWYDKINDTAIVRLFNAYFTPSIVSAERIPDDGALMVANHSGMGLDAAALFISVYNETGIVTIPVAHNLFGGSEIVKTLGVLTQDRSTVIDLLKKGRLVHAFPGGAVEIAKPFTQRYKVNPVHGFNKYGYLLTAIEAQKPIVPIGIVGAEETQIILGDIKPLVDDFIQKQYAALPETVKKRTDAYKKVWDIAQACPLPLNLIPFKSKITSYVGHPISVDAFTSFPVSDYRTLRAKDELTVDESAMASGLEQALSTMNREVMSSIEEQIARGYEPGMIGNAVDKYNSYKEKVDSGVKAIKVLRSIVSSL